MLIGSSKKERKNERGIYRIITQNLLINDSNMLGRKPNQHEYVYIHQIVFLQLKNIGKSTDSIPI